MSKSKYTVRTGENIYDVALTLYGSIEGIFDLLVSNDNLSMDTRLQKGDVLYYHDEFVINDDVVNWIEEKGLHVKNGDHQDDEDTIQKNADMKIIVRQSEADSAINDKLISGVMRIDWGDGAGVSIAVSDNYYMGGHDYQDIGEHIIRISGDFQVDILDFKDLNGVYYALAPIEIFGEFNSNLPTNEELNKLFIIKEQAE